MRCRAIDAMSGGLGEGSQAGGVRRFIRARRRERNVHLIVSGSGFAEWWEESRMLFSDEFVDWIDSLMAIEPDWLVAMNAKTDGRRANGADAAPS